MKTCCLILFLSYQLLCVAAWNYRDQHTWKDEFPTCDPDSGTKLQSPLSVWTPDHDIGQWIADLVDYPPLEFGSGWFSNTFWTITNNDRYLVWFRYEEKSVPATIRGGPLPANEIYAIEEIDFHVGDNRETGVKHRGSEHTINQIRHHGELQLVFRNVKYTEAEALVNADGYAVISLLLRSIQVVDADVEKLDKSGGTIGIRKFIRAAKRFAKAIAREQSTKFLRKNKKAKKVVVDMTIGKFLHDIGDLRKYVAYNGSFTSPFRNCAEVVTWIVYPDPIDVLEHYLTEMRSPSGNSGLLKNNWRQEVFDVTRRSQANTGLSGYPTWIPYGGNDTNKEPRRQRFYRHDIRQVVKSHAALDDTYGRVFKTLQKELVKKVEAEAILTFAEGTPNEAEALQRLELINGNITLMEQGLANLETALFNLEDERDEKNANIGTIVRARYGFGVEPDAEAL